MQLNPRHAAPRRAAGFSMVEVLVTVVIIAIGLLGLAKLQAASVSNSQISRTRSMIALQADSLAAAMHGNRAFWAATPAGFTSAAGVVTDTTGSALTTLPTGCTVATASTCCVSATASCSAAEFAAADVNTWAANLYAQFPSYSLSTVLCSAAAPYNCTIKIEWNESYVAVNKSAAANAASLAASQNLTLYVQP